jgi:hypothetical protein
MIEFEHNGQQYKAEKLPAMQQFHISRKVGPLVPPLVPIFLEIARSGALNVKVAAATGEGDKPATKAIPQLNLDRLAMLFQPFMDGLALMKDEDAEYVLSTCLLAVKRRVGESWQPVWNGRAKMAMFDDLNDVGQLWPIAMRVLQDSLGPFINGLLMSQQAALSEALG